MKDFAGSSITYYGLARERLMNKYPRLISVLVILSLICMTGLALFIISDLVSFASNSDRNGVLVGLDLKGPENGITSMTNVTEKSGNISANSENLSRQTKEQSLANLSKMNTSLSSSQAAKGGVAASKSSPVVKHHSSSSSSSAMSAKKSNDKNNLTNETASMNKSQISNDSVLASLPSVAIGPITNPSKDTTAREPVSIIKFKTKATLSPKSDQGQNPDNGGNTASATVSGSSNKAQSSKGVGTKSVSSQKSKVTASSQVKKTQEARAKQKANRDRIVANMKKKAAESRAKASKK